MHMHACTHAHTHKHAHTTHVRTHTYTHMHTHTTTHTQVMPVLLSIMNSADEALSVQVRVRGPWLVCVGRISRAVCVPSG